MTLPRQTPRQTGRSIASTATAFLAEESAAGRRALSSLFVLLVVVLVLTCLIGGS